jgi:hypothetical protein
MYDGPHAVRARLVRARTGRGLSETDTRGRHRVKIALFGATGATGRLLVALALDSGHEVVALARNPEKLADFSGRALLLMTGELSDGDAVDRAIDGAEAVISVLGPGRRLEGTTLSDGVRTIVESMERRGVRRLVMLSTASVADPEDRSDVVYGVLVSLIRLGARGAYDEIVRMGSIVRFSRLDWTLVRVGLLNNRPLGKVRVGHYGRGEVGLAISRASVADFLLRMAESTDHIREAPAVSN